MLEVKNPEDCAEVYSLVLKSANRQNSVPRVLTNQYYVPSDNRSLVIPARDYLPQHSTLLYISD